ncbi:hypothetical protein U1E44_10000 [Arenibacter sp. GZD96]|nr:hypothetical protein [Arenibacter sp. GZD-96]MEA1786424.1 hypothetical protein [Arenibacter sp. GZD-96]
MKSKNPVQTQNLASQRKDQKQLAKILRDITDNLRGALNADDFHD